MSERHTPILVSVSTKGETYFSRKCPLAGVGLMCFKTVGSNTRPQKPLIGSRRVFALCDSKLFSCKLSIRILNSKFQRDVNLYNGIIVYYLGSCVFLTFYVLLLAFQRNEKNIIDMNDLTSHKAVICQYEVHSPKMCIVCPPLSCLLVIKHHYFLLFASSK